MRIRKHIMSLALLATSVGMYGSNTVDTLTTLSGYTSASYNGRVTCHDPSIFLDTISTPASPQYYIYGSHLGRGRTSGLSNAQAWTTFFAGEEATDATNSLFANLSGTRVNYSQAYNTHAVKKVKNKDGVEVDFGNFNAHDWQSTGYSIRGNQWAPDVIWNKTMNKWCMYMSINGDHWASVIVCLTSDSPRGPWVYQGPVVFSGFQGNYDHVGFTKTKDYEHTDLQIALGSLSSLPSRYAKADKWGTFWPNCIDPCVFYDDDDNLWMSYGSWSGGIFMLRLNPENGLRDYQITYPSTCSTNGDYATCTSDPYFGKKIAGGYYVSGEASYIEKIGNYYFLFMSYGGLDSKGGYQMRVFRSTKPDGPYVDIAGNKATYTSYQMNYSATSKSNRGQLLMGGYKWDLMSGAEIAQGHNSAIVDPQGRAFVVYHTRFSNGGEGHQVRVHQLFLNKNGWLVSSPYEFSGETVTQEQIASTEIYPKSAIVGTYQVIRHLYCQDTANKAYQTPVNITLNEDGTVTGEMTGTWALESGTSYINLTLGGVTYSGVLTEQTIDYSKVKALCIAAVSENGTFNNSSSCTKGVELWASKADAKAAIHYTSTRLSIPIRNGQEIGANVTLPKTGYLGASVSWVTSDPNVITSNGVIVGPGNAKLTLVISKDGFCYVKDYNITVTGTSTTIYYPEVGATDCSSPYLSVFSDPYTLSKGETKHFSFINHTKGTNNWENWLLCCYNDESRAVNYFILRADNWENKSGSNNGCQSNYNWDTFKTDMEGALVNMSVEYTTAGKVIMNSTITTASGKEFFFNYTYPSTLSLSKIALFFSVEKAYITSPLANGIENVEATDFNSNVREGIYDLNGNRYMSLPQRKGMYIVGGKKVIVR